MSETTLGKYRLLRKIAQGGMGEVYLARHEGVRGFSKLVVVKRILDHLVTDRAFSEMFINEARLAALLTHPNVAQVFDLGEDAGSLYIAMEYVHGHSLRAVNRQLATMGRSMPPGLAARICAAALRGLHYAHTVLGEDGSPLRLVHRDVSADNVLVGYDGAVKLVDFGVAKATALSQQTNPGVVKGKVAYMPPEQLLGEPIDGRADLYAVGVVLFELLTGKRPFTEPNDTALMMCIVREPAPAVKASVPDIDPPLAAIVAKALAKRAADRYQTAEEMADALEAVATRLGQGPGLKSLLLECFGESAAQLPVLTPSGGAVPAVAALVETRVREPTDAGLTPKLPQYAEALVTPRPERTGDAVVLQGVALAEPSAVAELSIARRPRRAAPLLAIAGLSIVGAGIALGLVARQEFTAHASPAAPLPPPSEPKALPAPPPASPEPAPQVAPAVALPTPPRVPPAVAQPVPAPPPAALTGRVDVMVLPWGEVRLGKRLLGVTPMDPVSLPAGPQVLSVSNPDLKVQRTVKVQVPAGGLARVKVNLME